MQHDPFSPHLLDRLPFPVRKVAILRASRIGDFLCAVPALRALHAKLPNAELHMITLPLLQTYAGRLSLLSRVWPFPGFPGIAEQLFDARTATDFLRQMQRERFDLAIQMQGTGVHSNPFVLLLGARANAGFVRPGDQAGLLAAALPYPHHLHEVRCVLALSEFLGAPSVGEELEFPLSTEERAEAAALLENLPLPWIGLHPSARDQARRWPVQCYASLAEQLLARHGGTILLLGDAEAESAGQFLAARLGLHCLNLIGKVSLMLLGALIERLSLLVTNDSGPAHIAYALRTPAVTLFGTSASPQTNGPLQPGPFRLFSTWAPSASLADGEDETRGIQHIPASAVLYAAEALLVEQHSRSREAHVSSHRSGKSS